MRAESRELDKALFWAWAQQLERLGADMSDIGDIKAKADSALDALIEKLHAT